MTGCAMCGGPAEWTEWVEEHHHNQQRGDNDPDNLRDVCRRCHMEHHDNPRAVDRQSTVRFGPRRPRIDHDAPNLTDSP